jgi:hypothetical protein
MARSFLMKWGVSVVSRNQNSRRPFRTFLPERSSPIEEGETPEAEERTSRRAGKKGGNPGWLGENPALDFRTRPAKTD